MDTNAPSRTVVGVRDRYGAITLIFTRPPNDIDCVVNPITVSYAQTCSRKGFNQISIRCAHSNVRNLDGNVSPSLVPEAGGIRVERNNSAIVFYRLKGRFFFRGQLCRSCTRVINLT